MRAWLGLVALVCMSVASAEKLVVVAPDAWFDVQDSFTPPMKLGSPAFDGWITFEPDSSEFVSVVHPAVFGLNAAYAETYDLVGSEGIVDLVADPASLPIADEFLRAADLASPQVSEAPALVLVSRRFVLQGPNRSRWIDLDRQARSNAPLTILNESRPTVIRLEIQAPDQMSSFPIGFRMDSERVAAAEARAWTWQKIAEHEAHLRMRLEEAAQQMCVRLGVSSNPADYAFQDLEPELRARLEAEVRRSWRGLGFESFRTAMERAAIDFDETLRVQLVLYGTVPIRGGTQGSMLLLPGLPATNRSTMVTR